MIVTDLFVYVCIMDGGEEIPRKLYYVYGPYDLEEAKKRRDKQVAKGYLDVTIRRQITAGKSEVLEEGVDLE